MGLFSQLLKGRLLTSQDWFVIGVGLHKLGRAPGMSTKPSHGLAHHCMGLSSGDNWLSIRDRDNNVTASRKAVNHYLSVRRPWLPGSCLHSLQSLSLFHSYTWFTLRYRALSLSLTLSHVALPAAADNVYNSILFLYTTFPKGWLLYSLSQDKWVSAPRFKGLPLPPADCCHSSLALLKGQTFPWLHTLLHVGS